MASLYACIHFFSLKKVQGKKKRDKDSDEADRLTSAQAKPQAADASAGDQPPEAYPVDDAPADLLQDNHDEDIIF